MIAAGPDNSPRTALVTGAAGRIGRAITLGLIEAGFAVAIHAHRSAAAANNLADAIAATGGHAAVVHADLADDADVARLVPAAAGAIGPLSLLLNNACELEREEPGRLDLALWDQQFAVNLRAPMLLADAFAAQLPRGTDGSIINLLDQQALGPTPRVLSYTLSMAALSAATVPLAQALAPRVRVNAVAARPSLRSRRQEPGGFASRSAPASSGHGPARDEIVAAVRYLVAARSVTGQTIAIDGGPHTLVADT